MKAAKQDTNRREDQCRIDITDSYIEITGSELCLPKTTLSHAQQDRREMMFAEVSPGHISVRSEVIGA